jgi:cell wall-associated NlpC family hydrolase
MAIVTSNEYDHIDVVNGSNTNRHYIKDTTARNTIENLKSALTAADEWHRLDMSYGSKWYIRTDGTIGGGNNGGGLLIHTCKPNTNYLVVISPEYNLFKLAYANEAVESSTQLYGVVSGNSKALTITTGADAVRLIVQVVDDTEVTVYEIGGDWRFYNRTESVECVDNYAGLLASTGVIVQVVHNDGPYGDGGECLFEVTDETQWSIARNDGTYVRPVIGQGELLPVSANIGALMQTMSGYVGNSEIKYGSQTTLFDATCDNEMDCSSFVSAILNGIAYENSRYLSSNAANVPAYGGAGMLPNERLYSGQIASWFAQHKQLFAIPENTTTLNRLIQPGDLLFYGPTTETNSVYQIDHVAIVLANLYPAYQYAIIAQAGGAPGTDSNLNSTNVKISIVNLGSSEVLGRCRAFARPIYAATYADNNNSILNKVLGGDYYFDTHFIPGLLVNTNGIRSYSSSWSADPVMHSVVPGKTITNESGYLGRIAYYDANRKFTRRVDISNGRTGDVGNNEYYALFMVDSAELSNVITAKYKMA